METSLIPVLLYCRLCNGFQCIQTTKFDCILVHISFMLAISTDVSVCNLCHTKGDFFGIDFYENIEYGFILKDDFLIPLSLLMK